MYEVKEPSLATKLRCALFVTAYGAERCGIWTRHRLMWPYTDYTDDDVRRVAARVTASVCTALLEGLPLQTRQRIWTDQAEYLSFALDELPPGESCSSPEARSPRPDESPEG